MQSDQPQPGRDLGARRLRDAERGRVAVVERPDATGYLYRPGELLLGRGAVDVLRSEVDHPLVREDEETNERLHRLGRGRLDLQRWTMPPDVRLPELAKALTGRLRSAGTHLELNHVFAGEPIYRGGPGDDPSPASELRLDALAGPSGGGPQLSVLDTGFADSAPKALRDSVPSLAPDDVDTCDGDGDGDLDTEAGHGTFITGLVRQLHPTLTVQHCRVLDPMGWGDDLAVALGIAEATAPVLNLSLGGYTKGDRTPPALSQAVAALGPDRVVVAAAGNNRLTRRFWPAAIPSVVAVAAYDSRADQPADFTNSGPWVDVCAPGVRLLSSYVDGVRVDDGTSTAFAGWACWSGTSFAAPLVAAELAERLRVARLADPAAAASSVVQDFLDALPPAPWPGMGRRFAPDRVQTG